MVEFINNSSNSLDALYSLCFQGMGGTLAAVSNILAIAISRTPLDQGFGYFFTALSVIVLALIGYLTLPALVSV